MNVIIVGCGRMGSTLAWHLHQAGGSKSEVGRGTRALVELPAVAGEATVGQTADQAFRREKA